MAKPTPPAATPVMKLGPFVLLTLVSLVSVVGTGWWFGWFLDAYLSSTDRTLNYGLAASLMFGGVLLVIAATALVVGIIDMIVLFKTIHTLKVSSRLRQAQAAFLMVGVGVGVYVLMQAIRYS